MKHPDVDVKPAWKSTTLAAAVRIVLTSTQLNLLTEYYADGHEDGS